MSNPLIEVADAVVNALNTHVFSQQFLAARSYADFELALEGEPDVLHCDVVPVAAVPVDARSRGSLALAPAVDIALRRKFSADHLETVDGTNETRIRKTSIDPLVLLVQEIVTWLAMRPLAASEEARWKAPKIIAAVTHKHLRDWHQYTGIIRQPYEFTTDLPA